MEAEFLENIHYDLSVKSSEFKYWRQLLDDFILSAPRQNLPPSAHTSLAPVYPAPSLVARESTYTVSSLPGGESHSSSLRGWSPSDILSYEPSTFRKRTAADAFIDEMFSTVSNSAQPSTASRTAAVDQSSVSTHLVQPSRMMAREVMRRAVPSNYDHVRSSSPNRQIVALPRSGHLSPVGWSGQSRDAACEAESGNVFAPQAHMHESKDQNSLARIHDGSGCSVLVAPYEGQYQVQAIAPEVGQEFASSQGGR